MSDLTINKEDLQVALKEAGERIGTEAEKRIDKAVATINNDKATKAELETATKDLEEVKQVHKDFTEKAQAQLDEMDKKIKAKEVKLDNAEINLLSFRNTIKCLKEKGNEVSRRICL